MRRWLRAFFVFLSLSPVRRGALEKWTEGDTLALNQFFRTNTGGKLLELLRRSEHQMNASAVLRQTALEYACGYAAGFRGCSAWLQSLSVIGSPEEAEEHQLGPRGAADLADSLAP